MIRHKVLVDGRSSREVATEMGVSRNTVRRYLEVAEPRRVERKARARPVLEKVQERLDELIAEWRERTTAKQRLTGTRLHRELVTEGHSVGVTVMRDYVRERRRRAADLRPPTPRTLTRLRQALRQDPDWRLLVHYFALELSQFANSLYIASRTPLGKVVKTR